MILTVLKVVGWVREHLALVLGGLVLAGLVGGAVWVGWEVASTYAERDRLRDQVGTLRVTLETCRANRATAAQLRAEVALCNERVDQAEAAGEAWRQGYQNALRQLEAPARVVVPPEVGKPGTPCETAVFEAAQWLAQEVTRGDP